MGAGDGNNTGEFDQDYAYPPEGNALAIYVDGTPFPFTETKRYCSDDMAESFSAASPHFQWDVVVAEYAEVLRGSYWAEGSTLATVLKEAEAVSRLLPDDADVVEFVGLVRRAHGIARGR